MGKKLHLGATGEAEREPLGALGTPMPGVEAVGAIFPDNEDEDDDFPENWEPQGSLDAPTPRPGFTQHWVRMAILGQPDAQNLANRSHQGWRPRRVESVPEEERRRFPVFRDERLGDIIIREGLVLCEMPNRLVEKRNEHYRNKHTRQVNSLKDRIAEQNEHSGHGIRNMHIAEQRTDIGINPQIHNGRKPNVAAD